MWTATMSRSNIACAVHAVTRLCKNLGGAQKGGVEGNAMSAPAEGKGDHIRWAELWRKNRGVHKLGFWSFPRY